MPNFLVFLGVLIPVRDDIELSATLYLPKNYQQGVAAVICLTPYGRDRLHSTAKYFAENGIAFAAVDCRGCGDSSGEFIPHINDGIDGYDCVEWVAKQPWCSARVGMWGGSYSGYVQWATASKRPPSLKAIIPISAALPDVDVPHLGGIYYSFNLQWAALFTGRSPPINLFMDNDYWRSVYEEIRSRELSIFDHAEVVGTSIDPFFKWMESFPKDREARKSLYFIDYGSIDIPSLTVTGTWDSNQLGAVGHYRRKREQRFLEPADSIIIGPWDHAGCMSPAESLGAIKFGSAALVNLQRIALDWFQWHLQDRGRPGWLKKDIAVFDAIAGEWRFFEPDVEAVSVSFGTYGTTENRLHCVDLSGSAHRLELTPVSDANGSQRNPLNISEYIEPDLTAVAQPDAIKLLSEPLVTDLEIYGQVALEFYAQLQGEITDLEVLFYCIPHCQTGLLASRAQIRICREEAVRSGGENWQVCRIENFSFFYGVLTAGCVMQVVIRLLNSIYFQREGDREASGGLSIANSEEQPIVLIVQRRVPKLGVESLLVTNPCNE